MCAVRCRVLRSCSLLRFFYISYLLHPLRLSLFSSVSFFLLQHTNTNPVHVVHNEPSQSLSSHSSPVDFAKVAGGIVDNRVCWFVCRLTLVHSSTSGGPGYSRSAREPQPDGDRCGRTRRNVDIAESRRNRPQPSTRHDDDMGCQRQLLGVKWQDHVKHTDITDMTGLPNIGDIITKRRHTLFSHVVRLEATTPAHQALEQVVATTSIRDPSLSLTVFRNSLKTHLFVQ